MFGEKITALPNVVPVANERKTTTLQANVRTHLLRYTIAGTLDITTLATSIRNRGSIAAAYDEIGIEVDGEDRFIMDPRAARAHAEIIGRRLLPKTRATALAVGTYPLKETGYIFLAQPQIAKPEETSFLERDVRQEMKFFAKYNGLATKIVGGGVAALSAPSIRVTQIHDPFRSDLPLLRPSCRQMVSAVAAANDQHEISLRGSRYVGAILIQQDSDIGEVTDIISTISLRGDDGKDIIPQPLNYADAVLHAGISDDGANQTSDAYFGLDFLSGGRLSRLVHPYSYTNLRLVLNVTPSVTAGATNSKIRVTVFEFEQDTVLTAAALPFTI